MALIKKLKNCTWQDIVLFSAGVLLICSIIMLIFGVSAVPPTALKMPPMEINKTYHTNMYASGADNIESENITLKKNERIELNADGADGGCQWQVYRPESYSWANVYNDTASGCTVYYSKIKNMLDENGVATLRAVSKTDGEELESGRFRITVADDDKTSGESSEETAAETVKNSGVFSYDGIKPDKENPSLNAHSDESAAENTESEAQKPNSGEETSSGIEGAHFDVPMPISVDAVFTVTVNFRYEDGSPVNDSKMFEFQMNQQNPQIDAIELKSIPGYEPTVEPFDYENASASIDASKSNLSITIATVDQNMEFNVIYKPIEVDYTVNYYKQNLYDDGYTLDKNEVKHALTGSQITKESIAESYPGFSEVEVELPTVAGDGSTVIDLYYNRNYYKITFDLKGGVGENDIFVKYEMPISVPEPTKTGYTFGGWCSDEDCSKPAELPKTMPDNSELIFYAKWVPAKANYNIAIYIENSYNDRYSFYKSITEAGQAKTDSRVDIEDPKVVEVVLANMADDPDRPYLSVNTERSQSIASVNGDGSSTLNIYYDRNVYTLRFVYARTYYSPQSGSYNWNLSSNNNGFSTGDFPGLNYKQIIANSSAVTYTTKTTPSFEFTQEFADSISKSLESEDTAKSGLYTGSYVDPYRNDQEYYYIDLRAKYGQDISDLWPTYFSDSYMVGDTKYDFISWGTQKGTPYADSDASELTGGYNIKGVYSEMDNIMVPANNADKVFKPESGGDEEIEPAQVFVAYWFHGATRYEYQIYFSALPTELANNNIEKVHYDGSKGGKEGEYVFQDSYDIISTGNIDGQSKLNFKGMEYGDKGADVGKVAGAVVDGKIPIKYYYQRQIKTITFSNGYGNEIVVDIPYGESFKHYTFDTYKKDGEVVKLTDPIHLEDIAPVYPSSTYAEGAMEAEKDERGKTSWYQGKMETTNSWYVIPSTKIDFNGADGVMGENNIILYPKWEPKEYKARFYLNEDEDHQGIGFYIEQNFDYGGVLSQPDDPKNGLRRFDYWYYYDDEDKEQRVSFLTTAFFRDVDIFAKWDENVNIPYTIYYKLEDKNGEDVAAPDSGSALAGTTQTFTAKYGDELYEEFQYAYSTSHKGCYPVGTTSQSVKMDIDKAGDDGYVITFIYKTGGPIPYRVWCFEFDGWNSDSTPKAGDLIKPENIVEYDNNPMDYPNSDFSLSSVVVDAPTVTGYRLVTTEDNRLTRTVTRILTYAEPNTIIPENTIDFYYVSDDLAGKYSVEYYCQQFDGSYALHHSTEEMLGVVGSTYTAQRVEIPGYKLNLDAEGTLESGKIQNKDTTLRLKLYYDAMPLKVTKEWHAPDKTDISFDVYKVMDTGFAAAKSGEFSMTVEKDVWSVTFYLPYLSAGEHYAVVEKDNEYITSYDPEEKIMLSGKSIQAGKFNYAEGAGAAEVTVTNIRELKTQLPLAGSGGTQVFFILGAFLTAAPIAVFFIRRRLGAKEQ